MNTPVDAYAIVRSAEAAGCRIQADRGINDRPYAPRWETLTEKAQFTCPPHLYRVHPDDAPTSNNVSLVGLVGKWEARSREAHPSDAMLINRHVRELREAIAYTAASCGEERLRQALAEYPKLNTHQLQATRVCAGVLALAESAVAGNHG